MVIVVYLGNCDSTESVVELDKYSEVIEVRRHG